MSTTIDLTPLQQMAARGAAQLREFAKLANTDDERVALETQALRLLNDADEVERVWRTAPKAP